jgi:two-component system OmpR family response regulator
MWQQRLLILLIDDDQTTATVLRNMFEIQGYAVETATRGSAALARIAAGGISLVLLDLTLPDMDGLTLCRQLRARDSEQANPSYWPIIVLTSAGDVGAPAACFLAGADEYLHKPFETDALVRSIQRWTGVPGTTYEAC